MTCGAAKADKFMAYTQISERCVENATYFSLADMAK